MIKLLEIGNTELHIMATALIVVLLPISCLFDWFLQATLPACSFMFDFRLRIYSFDWIIYFVCLTNPLPHRYIVYLTTFTYLFVCLTALLDYTAYSFVRRMLFFKRNTHLSYDLLICLKVLLVRFSELPVYLNIFRVIRIFDRILVCLSERTCCSTELFDCLKIWTFLWLNRVFVFK